jgi:hypothetical protein
VARIAPATATTWNQTLAWFVPPLHVHVRLGPADISHSLLLLVLVNRLDATGQHHVDHGVGQSDVHLVSHRHSRRHSYDIAVTAVFVWQMAESFCAMSLWERCLVSFFQKMVTFGPIRVSITTGLTRWPFPPFQCLLLSHFVLLSTRELSLVKSNCRIGDSSTSDLLSLCWM